MSELDLDGECLDWDLDGECLDWDLISEKEHDSESALNEAGSGSKESNLNLKIKLIVEL